MSSTHTPGPWELDYDKGSTRDILSRKHGGICTVRRAGRHNDQTYNANARLIAAAPELLDALKKLLNECDGEAFAATGTAKAEMLFSKASEARAAIAKAEGSK